MSITESNAKVSYATTRMVRDTCLCLHLQRAARAVARRFDEALRPLGLTSGQFSLLMSLNRPEPPTIGHVAGAARDGPHDLDRQSEAPAPPRPHRAAGRQADRRSRRLMLTRDGRDLLAEALPIWRTRHREIEKLLAGSDADGLRADLRALS